MFFYLKSTFYILTFLESTFFLKDKPHNIDKSFNCFDATVKVFFLIMFSKTSYLDKVHKVIDTMSELVSIQSNF